MATVDLWPDEISTDVELNGPSTILREQAAFLAQKTKNLVKAEIISKNKKLSGEDVFTDDFFIHGPIIDYRFQLFSISYPIEYYPVSVHVDMWSHSTDIRDQSDFEEFLTAIFSDDKTLRVIQAIIARSKEKDPFFDE